MDAFSRTQGARSRLHLGVYVVTAADVRGGVGRRHHRNAFADAVVRAYFLRVDRSPGPFVFSVAEPGVRRTVVAQKPGVADRKESFDGRRNFVRVTEQQRFVIPLEPEVFVQSPQVNVPVHGMCCLRCAGVHNERELGRLRAFFAHRRIDVSYLFDYVEVGESVGYVEQHHVDAGIAEHLGVFADDPFVVGYVVPHVGFSPVMENVFGPQCRIGRIRIEQLLDVVRTFHIGCGRLLNAARVGRQSGVVRVASQPQEVKNAHCFFSAGFGRFVIHAGFDGSVEAVDRRPRQGIHFGDHFFGGRRGIGSGVWPWTLVIGICLVVFAPDGQQRAKEHANEFVHGCVLGY